MKAGIDVLLKQNKKNLIIKTPISVIETLVQECSIIRSKLDKTLL